MNIHGWKEILNDLLRFTEGMEGENLIRNYFIKKGIKHMQVDLIFKGKDGEYKLAEIKHQEIFEPPPFKGHGLPIWQIEDRLKFYKETNIEPWLFVVDKETNIIYYQSFVKLMQNEYFDTKGKKPRRVFNINSFAKLDYKA
jgi:hypothetical protein